jgi:hypothetical protein
VVIAGTTHASLRAVDPVANRPNQGARRSRALKAVGTSARPPGRREVRPRADSGPGRRPG